MTKKEMENKFDELWVIYPRKKGKKDAKRHYIKAIKEGTTHEEIKSGLLAFTEEIRIKGTQKQYIPYGSTWFSKQSWEDEYDTEENQPQSNTWYRKTPREQVLPEYKLGLKCKDDIKVDISDEEANEILKKLKSEEKGKPQKEMLNPWEQALRGKGG